MRLKLLHLISISLAIVLAAPSGAWSAGAGATMEGAIERSSHGVYIVMLAQDPVIAYTGDMPGYKATKPAKGKKLNPKSAHVRKYDQFLARSQAKVMKAAGLNRSSVVHEYRIALNGFAARMSHEQAKAMLETPGVTRVVPDELLQLTTDNSPDFLGLSDPGGPYEKYLTGEGVVVGVIDTGVWPEHPSFADDGTYAAPPITLADTSSNPSCEFGNTAHNSSDVPFTCNNKLIGARQMMSTYRAIIGAEPTEFDSARDDYGHGSHTASTAAGNAGVSASIFGIPRGVVSGIAHRAHVVAYKACGGLGCFTSDTTAAIDQAAFDGVDVINYSIGGGASLGGADDIAFLFAADAGVHSATSAGNSGPGAFTVGGPASTPWITAVGSSTQDRTFQGSASSSDGWEFFGASVTAGTAELPLVDAADAGDELCFPGSLSAAVVTGKIVLCKRGAIARVDKSRAVMMAGGVGTILYNATDAQTTNTDNHWTPAVHINNTDGLVIKAYIASAGASAVAQINGGEFTEIDAPDMAASSSRGPNVVAEDIIKPDVTAPGVNILAAHTPMPNAGAAGGPPGQYFQAISGTSMASPHVAGIFALIAQANPDWSPAMVKSAVMTTAHQDVRKEDGATAAEPFDFGAGHVAPGGKANKGSIFEPGLAYDAGFLDYLGFLCDADPSVFADPTATCDTLAASGVATEATNLNYPSIGIAEVAGSETVVRTVTSVAKEGGWRNYSASVDAPDGYEVTVTPSSFRIKRGQTMTFDVTVTNVSAPVGEWRYGSLTWQDKTGNYSVRSPIAVKGSL